jgi:hypothetical protein
VEVLGSPAPDAQATIRIDCSASFGHLIIRYI